MEISMEVPQITKNKTPALAFLGVYSKELGTTNHRNTCTNVLIGTLFTMVSQEVELT